jgi:hypothetical protein
MLETEKFWNIASVDEDNMTQDAVSSWIIKEQGGKEWVSKGGLIWLKHDVYMSEIPR